VHVVDVASRKDRVVYNGETPFEVIAFGSDGVYLAQAINPRQGVFAKLFRLDPAGGSPQLVRGSDRHMDPTGWTKVSGGAAWGLDFRVNGTVYTYQVERLDLATGLVTQWLQGGPERQWAPMGTDDAKRLYVTDGYEVWRLSRPGQVDTTIGGTQVAGALTFGTEVLADSNGAWFPGRGGVWLYSDAQGLRELAAGPESEMVFPAGACT
jgi:hypothetical protein